MQPVFDWAPGLLIRSAVAGKRHRRLTLAMGHVILAMLMFLAVSFGVDPAIAQSRPARPRLILQAAAPGFDRLTSYADVAELTLISPVIVRASIIRTTRATGMAAAGVAAGRTRLVVTASVTNVLVAPGALAGRLQWLWDAPTDAQGRLPATKGLDVLAFLTNPTVSGDTRLMSRRSLQGWDPALNDRVLALASAARSGNVPVIRIVSNGFRAAGTVPGESESQFFLTTADAKPLTLIVQNRPGEMRRVMLAQGDIIDDSAAARVQPDTLLWYRLVCFLPAELPAEAGGDDPALAGDWRGALASLGPCGKTG